MKSVKVKVSELKPDRNQPRKLLEGIKELGNSMRYKGQLSPIVISKDFEILDGHRRYYACKEVDMEFLDAVIINDKRKLTPFLKKAYPFAINTEREGFKAWDMADSIYDIYWNYFLEEYEPKTSNDNGYSEFSKYMGLSKTVIANILSTYTIAKESKPLRKALKKKDIPFSTLKEISSIPKEDHSYYLKIVDKEMQKPLKNRAFMRDKIRDERLKTNIQRKDYLTRTYIKRLKNKIKNVTSIVDNSILDLATSEQAEEIKKALKPIYKIYKNL